MNISKQANSVLLVRNADFDIHPSFIRTIKSFQLHNEEKLKNSKNIIEKVYVINRKRKQDIRHISKETLYVDQLEIELYTIHTTDEGKLSPITDLKYYSNSMREITYSLLPNILFAYIFDLDSSNQIYKILDRNNIPFIYHIADFYSDSRIKRKFPKSKLIYQYFRQKEFKVMKKSYKSNICTESRYEQILGYTQNNVEVIHNSPVVNDFRLSKENAHLSETIKIGYVGSLSDERYISNLVEYVKNNGSVELYIAGFGPLENFIKTEAEKYKNISFFGKLPYKDALNLYSNVDYIWGCYDPSGYNTRFAAPNKFYESLLLSKPIIVTKGSSVDDLVLKHKTGIIIDKLEKLKLKNRSTQEYLTLSHNCRESYPEFAWNQQCKKLSRIYLEIIQEYGVIK